MATRFTSSRSTHAGTSARIVRESFHMFDQENKGWLTKHQIKCAIASLVGRKPTKAEVKALQNLSGNNQVDFDLFLAYMKDRGFPANREEHIRSIFKAFDIKCMGFITRRDLHAVCRHSASHVPGDVIDEIFDEIDTDHDGRISCRDFAAMMR